MTRGRDLPAIAVAAALLATPCAGRAQTEADGPKPYFPVLAYLEQMTGRSFVSGIHNREPNSRPDLQTNQLEQLVGRYPAIWSGDFLFEADAINCRWVMIYECKNEWDKGSIVHLMMHVAPPNQTEDCAWEGGILSHLTDAEWTDLITDGGSLNKVWKSRLDDYANYLAYLRDNGVQVLFRPFHEMNQGQFWWGGRKGARGTARLYQLTHDYLTRVKKLNNLIWVWDMQDISRDIEDYNPGNAYWDVFAFDVYGTGYNQSWYDYLAPIVGDKPMGIGECAKLPAIGLLDTQPRWCFFISWAELTFTANTNQQILALYRNPKVVTRDRLPFLKAH
jgi:mannan endo-1,4-beta-mannosidase